MKHWTAALTITVTMLAAAHAQVIPAEKEYTNSIGMKFVRIEPGGFMMGNTQDGDFDERPIHKVNITNPFLMAATEVTNAQFEQFDKSHKKFRGIHELSNNDDEAVIYVNWEQANAFCDWLSQKESLPYRLPTEAEWEYACRAGTATKFSTGDELPQIYHKNQQTNAFPAKTALTVASTPANPCGLYDMHGNVEEWCMDWYGPYIQNDQTNPIGRIDGNFRVTRGGSHNTNVKYLTSANRMGTLPDDKHWLIGFRVVIGKLPTTKPLPIVKVPLWGKNVSQLTSSWKKGPNLEKPYFEGPRRFMTVPEGSKGRMWSGHNHQPAITSCKNGDLLAIWYSTTGEEGRNLLVVAARLRQGNTEWDVASPFWDAPDRNDHGSALLWDKRNNTIYHFNGLAASGTWANLALIMRTSTDNGATWSKARIIEPTHGYRNQVIAGSFITKQGYIIVPCDAVPGGSGGSAIHISKDNANTWRDPGRGREKPEFKQGKTGAWIAGIHTGCAQLNDGSLLAFSRGDRINGKMPMSISKDMGENWTYATSGLPGIGGGERLVLLKLKQGPLFLASFANDKETIMITDASGKKRTVEGLFGAISYDEGKTWPVKRLITDDGPGRICKSTDGREFTLSFKNAERKGYLAGTQSPDGVIHLISSWNHYAFNLKWLETLPPAEPADVLQ